MSRSSSPLTSGLLAGKALPLLAVAAGILLLFLFHDAFGIAWDDYLQAQHGENCLDFYLSLGADRSFLEFENMYLYGSVFETLSAGFHRVVNESDIFRYRGLFCGLAALLATALTIRLAAISGFRGVSWFAGLFLLTSTQFWGQAFVNSKDIPFTAAYVLWWLGYIQWFRKGFMRDRYLVVSGVALGLVLGIRIVGIPFLGFTVCAGMLGWVFKGRTENQSWGCIIRSFPWLNHLLVLFLGWGVLILVWPTALLRPVMGPIEAFYTYLTFPWKIYVTFLDTTRFSDTLPRYAFFLEHFLAQPLWCYPFYLAGIAALVRRWKTGDPFQRFLCVSLGFWILPLFLIFAIKPFSFYNGVRQSLFLWPAYAWLAAFGIQEIYHWVEHMKQRVRWIFAVGSAVILMNTLLLIAQHPFNYTYRNPVVRMLPGGINGFDTDYHALSYRLAARYIDRISMERTIAGELPPTVLVVASAYTAACYQRYIQFPARSLFHYEIEDDAHIQQFEYIVILHHLRKKPWIFRQFNLEDCRIAHQIQSNGQIYTTIYRRPAHASGSD